MGLDTTKNTMSTKHTCGCLPDESCLACRNSHRCKTCGAVGPHRCPGLDFISTAEGGPIPLATDTTTYLAGLGITLEEVNSSDNNGGSTDYYKFKPSWKECGDIIEARDMNYNQGNIFKASFCFNTGRHEGTNTVRELNKIIYFAERELERIKGQ